MAESNHAVMGGQDHTSRDRKDKASLDKHADENMRQAVHVVAHATKNAKDVLADSSLGDGTKETTSSDARPVPQQSECSTGVCIHPQHHRDGWMERCSIVRASEPFEGPSEHEPPPAQNMDAAVDDANREAPAADRSLFGGDQEVVVTESKVRKCPDEKDENDNTTKPKRSKLAKDVRENVQPAKQPPPQMTAALLVGPEGIIIISEKEALVRHSPYFQYALGKGFVEGDTRALQFPDERPETINWYITWIYSQCSQLPGDDGPLHTAMPMYLYCFAEKIQCIALKNQLIEQLYGIVKKQFLSPRGERKLEQLWAYINPDAIKYAMGRLPETSPLWKLLIAFFHHYVTPERLATIKHTLQEFPAEFHAMCYRSFLENGGIMGKAKFPRLNDLFEKP